ncbi:MAG: hypothetical protein IT454_02150 [Planctomycetes bacterium]|nr:hypothetical protein [Planctomycetota bacterium]
MNEQHSDFAHAHEELTRTPWPAHLAAAAAGVTCIAAWVLLTLVSPMYLRPYAEQGIALEPLPQLVLHAALKFGGALAWVGIAVLAGLVFFGWVAARKSGGIYTILLFGLAVIGAAGAIAIVLACGNPTPTL